jgi:hypothetical protein
MILLGLALGAFVAFMTVLWLGSLCDERNYD